MHNDGVLIVYIILSTIGCILLTFVCLLIRNARKRKKVAAMAAFNKGKSSQKYVDKQLSDADMAKQRMIELQLLRQQAREQHQLALKNAEAGRLAKSAWKHAAPSLEGRGSSRGSATGSVSSGIKKHLDDHPGESSQASNASDETKKKKKKKKNEKNEKKPGVAAAMPADATKKKKQKKKKKQPVSDGDFSPKSASAESEDMSEISLGKATRVQTPPSSTAPTAWGTEKGGAKESEKHRKTKSLREQGFLAPPERMEPVSEPEPAPEPAEKHRKHRERPTTPPDDELSDPAPERKHKSSSSRKKKSSESAAEETAADGHGEKKHRRRRTDKPEADPESELESGAVAKRAESAGRSKSASRSRHSSKSEAEEPSEKKHRRKKKPAGPPERLSDSEPEPDEAAERKHRSHRSRSHGSGHGKRGDASESEAEPGEKKRRSRSRKPKGDA